MAPRLPWGDPRFPMTTLCSIQTPSLAKVSFSLQTEQQLHMTPMSTKRPRFQFGGKICVDLNENA